MRRLLICLVAIPLAVGGQPKSVDQNIAKEVNRELWMLSNYGVFDWLGYRVQDREVTLVGFVRQPALKNAAGSAVRQVNGVEVVNNNIEVLPNSPNDDRIRLAVYSAVYSQPALQRYQLAAIPPIHILVKNGDVVLEGNVSSELDKNLAGTTANGVSGVLKVTNNLRVETSR